MKALYEQDLFPRIIAGSSIGAMTAAAIASHKYSDLWRCFTQEHRMMTGEGIAFSFKTFQDALCKLWNGEDLIDKEYALKGLCRFVKDLTFLEIYTQNGWNLNISVTDGERSSELVLLNYLTAPNVVVWSACIASCGMPVLFRRMQLMIKTESGELKPYYASRMKGT